MAKKRATKTKKSAKKPAKKRATATKPARKPQVKRAASTTRTRATKRRGPRSASERVAGLLLILPWLMKRKRVRLPEVARQFRMSEEDLVADLQMAAVCGVPPYTPDALVDVFVDDGWVIAEIPTLFSRPLRLTSAEMYAIVAMVDAAQRLPGASKRTALTSAVAKLRRLTPDSEDNPVKIDLPDDPLLEELQRSQQESLELRIAYFNPARSDVSMRTIRVGKIFSERGHWYVLADDDKSGAMRNFRVDRIQSIVRTGKTYDQVDVARRAESEADREWFGDTLESVTLRVRDDASWIAEAYPTVSRVKNRDGSVDVTLRIGSEHWLARLLLRGGGNVEVIEPAKYKRLQATTATEVRAKYA
ncbi:MAG: helix-turn-helix transcriptional regulator [Actinomycetota bacterium]